MTTYNPTNERLKKRYFKYVREAKGRCEATLSNIAAAIHRYENYTDYKELGSELTPDKIIGFKEYLSACKTRQEGRPFSKILMKQTLGAVKDLFIWQANVPGYKSKIKVLDLEYFNPSRHDIAVAKIVKFKKFATVEQIKSVIHKMPYFTEVQRRDRALIAFILLTGMRDAAVASIRIKHIDLAYDPILVMQEPDLVKTKFSKSIVTYFLPIGDDIREIFIDWLKELKNVKHYGFSDPVFPKTLTGLNDKGDFAILGLGKTCWQNTTSIRQIFREAFENAGLPYFNPHSVRNTLVSWAQEKCVNPEQFKAFSQNLGHDSPLTTFNSYGNLDERHQAKLIRELSNPKKDENELFEKIEALIKQKL